MFSAASVCQFVSVRTIASEWFNIGWWNLAVRCIVQKFRPSSNVKVKDQKDHHGQTNEKLAESSPLTMHSRACAVGRTQQAATNDTTAWPPRGDGLRRWENQRMMSSFKFGTQVNRGQYPSQRCTQVSSIKSQASHKYFRSSLEWSLKSLRSNLKSELATHIIHVRIVHVLYNATIMNFGTTSTPCNIIIYMTLVVPPILLDNKILIISHHSENVAFRQ